jgi:RNA polymerase sigma-70 factor (ECF subfamily)
LERIAAGDTEALDRLLRRCLPALRRWARGRLPAWARDLLETDDLVQETLLRTVRSLDTFEPEHSGAFHAYLRRGVLNRIRDELRRVGRQPRRGDGLGAVADRRPSPLEDAVGRQALGRYERALERLAPPEREAVFLRVELGYPYREVAAALGKPSPDAARMAVSRALVRLAEEMALA